MKEKNPWLAPSCASLEPRLYQIGMTEFSGEPEELNIAVLAGCLAGELYNRGARRKRRRPLSICCSDTG